jgi:hypothetical protein
VVLEWCVEGRPGKPLVRMLKVQPRISTGWSWGAARFGQVEGVSSGAEQTHESKPQIDSVTRLGVTPSSVKGLFRGGLRVSLAWHPDHARVEIEITSAVVHEPLDQCLVPEIRNDARRQGRRRTPREASDPSR